MRAEPEGTDPAFPDEMLVIMNLRDRKLFDVYRIKLRSGAVELDTQNPGDVAGWATDAKFQVRGAQVSTPDGGTEIRIRDDAKSPWKSWLKVGPEEILNFLDFTLDGKSVYIKSSIGRDTAAVVERNLATGAEKAVASSPEVDAGNVLINPRTHLVEAVAFAPGRSAWTVVDPAVKADFEGIRKLHDGDFGVVNRDSADKTWLVAFTSDRGPIRYYAWDRSAKQGTFLFVHQPKLEGLQLAEMKPTVITRPRRPQARLLPHAAGGRSRRRTCPWCSSSTAARGGATAGATTRRRSGSPTAATRCSRSTSAARTGLRQEVPERRQQGSGARRCTTT